jgi:hypothetical protein
MYVTFWLVLYPKVLTCLGFIEVNKLKLKLKQGKITVLCILIFGLRQEMRRQHILNKTITSIPKI